LDIWIENWWKIGGFYGDSLVNYSIKNYLEKLKTFLKTTP
jgi:hypothetical protein